MRGSQTFTLRASHHLASAMSSRRATGWLADFFRQPHLLPPDPGAGEERISLSLPRRAVKTVAAMHDCSPSEALRRLAADRLSLPQGNFLDVLPEVQGSPTGHEIVVQRHAPLASQTRSPDRENGTFLDAYGRPWSFDPQTGRVSGLLDPHPPCPMKVASARPSWFDGLMFLLFVTGLSLIALLLCGAFRGKGGAFEAPAFESWTPLR